MATVTIQYWAAAREAARRFAEETGAVLIHPFDHPDVVAGQGTVALEILEQFPEVGHAVHPGLRPVVRGDLGEFRLARQVAGRFRHQVRGIAVKRDSAAVR